jgi:hypothetical protein
LQWSVPRELLWAIIFSLAVFVIALWPSHYPYGQAPQIDSQQKSENTISSNDPADKRPATQIYGSGEAQDQKGSERGAEFAPLGIKPGEWLLGIATLLLWGATVRLVKGAERTTQQQLRAYVFVKNGRVDRLSDSKLRADITLENGGQTPAYDLIYKGRTFIVPPENPDDLGAFTEDIVIVGPRSPSPIYIVSRAPFTIENQYAYAAGTLKIFVRGAIQYRDAFDSIQTTEFGFEVFGDVWGSKGHLRPIKGDSKAT